jgi:hypothetical protein
LQSIASCCPGGVPRILSHNDLNLSICLPYCGVTLREWIKWLPELHHINRDFFDIIFQLYWIITVIGVKLNIVHGDFHIDQVLVEALPCECTRRYVAYKSEKKFAFAYKSCWKVTVVDWAVAKPYIPYTRSRSSSRQSSRSGVNPISSFPFPGSQYVFSILNDIKKVDAKAYSTYGPFKEVASGLSFLNFSIFEVLAPIKWNSNDIDPLDDITDFTFGLYFEWARSVVSQSSTPTYRRGRPRIHVNGAARSKAYRDRKRMDVQGEKEAPHDSKSDDYSIDADFVVPLLSPAYDLFGLIYDTSYIIVQESIICNSLGVFANENVASGTRLTEYVGQILSWGDAKGRDDWQKTHYRAVSKHHSVIDGIRLPEVFSGVGSFINSTRDTDFQPNAAFHIDDTANKVYIASTRDLIRGEEILIDYNYDWETFEAATSPPSPSKKRKMTRMADSPGKPPNKRQKKDET